MTRAGRRFLFAMFQGGGNIPLIMPIVKALADRGHDVRVIAGPGIRGRRQPVTDDFHGRIKASGAELVPFVEPDAAPHESAPPARGIAFGWTPKRFETVLRTMARTTVWSAPWASNVTDELGRSAADVLVCDYWLFGAIAAGEASGVPTAVIVHNAFPPGRAAIPVARGPLANLRELPNRWIISRIWARDGLPLHNAVRRSLGLPAIARSPFNECDHAARVLVLGYESFDFPPNHLHPNVRYVGTPIDDRDVTADAWKPPWQDDDRRPLVLVSMSTLPQGQGPALHRVVEAVGGMPVRALVTLGPSLSREDFRPAANVVLEQFVPHSAVLPHASVIVSQCGLSTLTKALRHGVPLLCLPILADQPANADRIVARGAGLQLKPTASVDQIRIALTRLLDEPAFRDAARGIGSQMVGDDPEERAADELEALVR